MIDGGNERLGWFLGLAEGKSLEGGELKAKPNARGELSRRKSKCGVYGGVSTLDLIGCFVIAYRAPFAVWNQMLTDAHGSCVRAC